jgi:hypothetical protein
MDRARPNTAALVIVLGITSAQTTLTGLHGIGDVLAAKILARTGAVSRFRSESAFASFYGVAPLEVSSGEVQRHRLSRAGDRQLNYTLVMAVTQTLRPTPGRDYYQPKRAAGKTPSARRSSHPYIGGSAATASRPRGEQVWDVSGHRDPPARRSHLCSSATSSNHAWCGFRALDVWHQPAPPSTPSRPKMASRDAAVGGQRARPAVSMDRPVRRRRRHLSHPAGPADPFGESRARPDLRRLLRTTPWAPDARNC